jgi:hypothetical protein
MKGINWIVAAAGLAFGGAALAGPKWNYIDVGYLVGNGGNETSNGYKVRASFGDPNNWHLGGRYSDFDSYGGARKGGAGLSGYDIYLGKHPAITADADLAIELGYAADERDTGVTTDITKWFLRAGPRVMLSEEFEISALVMASTGRTKQAGVKDDFSEVGFQFGGAFYFGQAWSVGADYESNGQTDDILNIYGRMSF